ncbi:hypothetical protein [Paenibacillus bouchesdurhonensis]|uniref:hypothetical protein n=1 Tax=Paenibacillus bouchesdurhonensis TaxID=1870990 RepID=UPI001F31F735|nr:hypothetical protein [Paenibacillus bouchesdurhonensis]
MESKMIFCNLHEAVLLPVYATTLGYWRHQPETVRPKGFPDSKLLFTLLPDLKRALQLPLNQDHEMERIKPVLEYVDSNLHRHCS